MALIALVRDLVAPPLQGMGGVDPTGGVMAGGVAGSCGGVGDISGGVVTGHPGIHRAKPTVGAIGGPPGATIIRVAQVSMCPDVQVSISPGISVFESPAG